MADSTPTYDALLAEVTALRQRERQLRALVEHSPDVIARFDRHRRHLYVNSAIEAVTGLPPEAFIGHSNAELGMPAELVARWDATITRVFETGQPQTTDFTFPGPAGERVFEGRLVPEFGPDGAVETALCINRDVTTQRQAEREAAFRAHLLDTVEQAVIATDVQGHVTLWNRHAEQLYGYTREEALGRTTLELIASPNHMVESASLMEALSQGQNWRGEIWLRNKGGDEFPVQVTNTPVLNDTGALVGIVGVSLDLSEHHRAAREYQTLFTEMLDGFALHEILCDEAGQPVDYRFLAVNPAFERITGLKAEALVGHTVLEAVPGTDPSWIETYGRVALTGEPAHFEQFHTGLGRHFEVTAYRPAPNQFACIFADITERERAEEALRESHALLAAFIKHSPIYAFIKEVTPTESRVLWASENYADMVGVPGSQMSGRTMEELFPPDFAAKITADDYAVASGGSVLRLDEDLGDRNYMTIKFPILSGERSLLAGYTIDVTERRRAEQALRESEARYRLLADNVSDVIWIMDLQGRFTYVSPSVFQLRGYTPEEVLQQTVDEAVCPSSHPALLGAMQQARSFGAAPVPNEAISIELEQPRIDGSTVWTEASARMLLDDEGQPTGIIGVSRDISERRHHELEYRSLVSATLDSFFVIDPLGQFLEVNDAYCRMLGYTRDELLAMHLREVEAVEDQAAIERHIQTIAQTGYDRFETRHRRKDGTLVDLEMSVTQLAGQEPRGFVFARDITERKRAEMTQQAMEELYRNLTEMTADYAFIVRVEPDGRHVTEWVSPGFVHVTGYTLEEHNALSDRSLLTLPEDRPLMAARRRILEAGGTSVNDYRIVTKDGEVRWLHSHARGEYDFSAGRVTRIIGAAQDATAVRRVQEALAESEARYRSLFEQTADTVLVNDLTGRILDANQVACQWLGYTHEELVGRNVREIIGPEPRERVVERQETILNMGSLMFDSEYVTRDGRRIPVETHVRRIEYRGEPALLAISRDITERKRAEQALLRQRDLAIALGRATSLQETLRLCTEAAIEVAGMDAGGIYLADAADGLNLVYHQGLPADFVEGVTYYPADSPNAVAVRVGQPAYTNMAALSAALGIPMPAIGIQALSVVPIHHEGRALGCLNVASFHLEDVPPLARSGLEALAGIIGQAIARQQATTALRESETRFRELFDHLTSGVALYQAVEDGADFILSDMNQAGWQITHSQPEHVLGRRVTEVFPGVAALGLLEVLRRVWRSGHSERLPAANYADDRLGFWVENRVYRLPTGEVVAVFDDVTERTRAEQAVRASEARLRRAETVANSGNWEMDLVTRTLRASDGARVIYDMQGEEWPLEEIHRALPEYRHVIDEGLRALIEEGRPYDIEFKILRPSDGRILDIRSIAEYDPERRRVFGVLQDITAHKRMELALRESEQRFRTLFERTPVGYQSLDPEGRLIEVNPTWLETLGYARDEVIGRWFGDFLTPDSQALFRECFARLIELGEAHDSMLEVVRRDQTTFLASFEGRCMYDEQGQFLHTHCIFVDVTERRKAEEALRRWAHVFEHAGWGISVGDAPSETLTLVNPAFARMLGYTTQELEHLPVELLYSPSDRATAKEHLREAHQQGHHTWEALMRRKDGTEFPALVDITVVYDETGQPDYRVANIQDLTERKNLEQQLAQAQKMEAVGRLAGGIAHDFNNLLTVINGYSDMLLDLLPPDDPMGADLEQIRGAGERAANLTRQLLAFSRRQVLQMRLLDLNTVLDGMAGLLSRIIGEDVNLRLEMASSLRSVRGDAGQIEQVVMNLAVNARDAMPTGGTLTIRTANLVLAEPLVTPRGNVPTGNYVTLSISDTGTGMSSEVLEHLFEPFFTTKEQGKGTGLGLAMVYGIIKQSGGEIEVVSQIGQGTTFRVYLPALLAAAQASAEESREALPLGRETILVVEDEEAVRQLTVRLLREMGYGVMEAANGAAALELFMATRRQIDLVLTDTVMPEMSGPELVRRLRQHRPDLKVLFTSGYTDGTALRHGMDEGEEAFLQKPFTRANLARILRTLLEE